MVIKLVASENELTLRSDKDGWCGVDLLHSGRTVRLGSDHLEVVAERLAEGLDRELKGDVVGVIGGSSVVRVLTLFEDHGTIFAADDDERRILFFQDASGDLIGRVTLDGEVRARWLEALRLATEGTSRQPGD